MSPAFPLTFPIGDSNHGQRLDRFLAGQFPQTSRAWIQQLIAQDKVLLNGAIAKAARKLRRGDQIRVLGELKRPPLRARAENVPLDIIYEDADLAVVNKPAGMLVHAGAATAGGDDPRNRGTLVNALLHCFGALSNVGGAIRPGIVHRLDRDTSGLIVVAKNDEAHLRLAEQFARRAVHKAYLALVHGALKENAGTICSAIHRDAIRRHRMTTRRKGGRSAVTHWSVSERITGAYGKFTLLEVKIETGRTHQIRVHLASIGHAVVGDRLYGAPREIISNLGMSELGTRKSPGSARISAALRKSKMVSHKSPVLSLSLKSQPLSLSRNFLHAAQLEFLHPATGAPMIFSAELPQELRTFLAELKAGRDQKPLRPSGKRL